MDKAERINKAYNYLIYSGIVRTKKDVADLMHTSRTCVSNALNGNESYLTTNFIKKFCLAFEGVFNLLWLMNGEGTMLQDCNISYHNIIDRQSIHNQTNGNNSPINEVENNDVLVNRLLDELSATRKQNDTLIELLKKQMDK